ncbi:MAG TPA: NADH-quinone oxidoreductase subunit J [Deltaproteobacteria bacterium]|nr:MAG: NADH-quinone oxidoreductase subunit J [Deltaproteobacteria bacterium GWA2_55_82]OGQ64183.1 MAG: NADH-quinone oxidoreductase subunit J [Deltaproteobacteria bacterium RIFCSPLOWO2_02_FULL_55_12]OIJ74637.1 MAG: NADH-quinone oxidoreductase subunit J [Deltaproteobacteria bacterium GWC2_55_46]HBG46417.1 NADH-quinone oxidoreductase subunit J [Deltaproteobacteria bacterium]HCY10629.1 NADH-quinone oxidoreductase subunit J [Deltaproteobacteria bacterium]
MEKFFFLMFAVTAVCSATAVVSLRNPVHSAISLMLCLFQVAALFILLRSPFVAMVQVFIYVGAVMVLFLFVVLVLDMRKTMMETFPPVDRRLVFGVILVLAAEMLFFIFASPGVDVVPAPTDGSTVESIGKLLFTKYLFPFEVVSVILLAALVAALVMVKERKS